jgi:addiction module RelE/StbE family toxin
MIVIHFHKKFEKSFVRLPKRVQEKVMTRIQIFQEDQHHPLLNNHSLVGKYDGYRSINITGDYRAVYKVIVIDRETLFIFIGTHSQLY